MNKKDIPREPLWINRLLYAASILTLFSVLLVATLGWESGHDHHAGLIADISKNLNGIPTREHCTTCHTNGGLPTSRTGSDTDQEHPDITPHSIESLGCTGCHLGEGMALDEKISHGLPGLGARSVLKGKDLQAACFKCHELGDRKGAERAWIGYKMFVAKACDTCHHVAGLGKGGHYGPDLSDIGSYLGLKRIQEAIRKPKKEPENSIMPRFPLSRSQTKNISYFLKSRVKNPFFTTPMLVQAGKVSLPQIDPIAPDPDSPPGERLLTEKKCLACHQFREKDGRIAPDLTFLGQMRGADYTRKFLTNPVRLIPGAIMPQIAMTTEEESSLVRFLETQAVGPVPEPSQHSQEPRPTSGPQYAGDHAMEGDPAKHLYMTLCQRCHAANGDGHGSIQPNLANFPRAFTRNADFFRNISDERIVKSVEKGILGTSMPPYGSLLDKSSRDRLLNVIFSAFIGIDRNTKTTLPPLPPQRPSALDERQVSSLFKDNCTRCHGIAGTGKGPEYLKHLPRPRNLTNHPYFSSIEDKRIARAIHDGIPGTAMAPFGDILTDDELWALVGKIRNLSESGAR